MSHSHEWKLEWSRERTVSAFCNDCPKTMTDTEICAMLNIIPMPLNTYKPDGIFIATEDDGSQWVMLEDFVTAQQNVQRTAFGASWNVRLANLIIRLGWWVAGIGSR